MHYLGTVGQRDSDGRPVRAGGAGGAMASPDFDGSFNPISSSGWVDYAHHTSTAPPPDFYTFLRPCDA